MIKKRTRVKQRGRKLQNTCMNGHICELDQKICEICDGACRMRNVKTVNTRRVYGDGSTVRPKTEENKGKSRRQKKRKQSKKKPRSYREMVVKTVRCKVVGYHKNGIKVELPNKKVKNIRRGVWSPYEKVYPLGTIVPVINSNDKYPSVAGWYKPKILKKYPKKSARKIQELLE